MRAGFVVDNSVVIGCCFGDEGNSYAETVLESLESAEAFVPAIWPLEVGKVLLVAERKKRLSQASVVRFLELVGGLPITVEQETPERLLKEIVSLAREHGLSLYDTSYLDLTTQDTSLSKAAKKYKVLAF
ncbi:MAG: type II toxin-antitoxin system VapC family toxin [Desulfobacterales bacterium]|jgi:predicted nucleic acid-binding protein